MASYRRLYRSRNERMIAGVAGGIAEYFNVDPTLIRLLFVVTAVAGGPGLLAYLVLWLIVPEEGALGGIATPPPPPPPSPVEPPRDDQTL